MPTYTPPTSSGWGVSLSLHVVKTLIVGTGFLGLALTAPARAADEARASDLVVGDAKATCTVIEYSSLSCPHCAHWHETVLPKLKKDYLETGKVKLILRDFPLNGPALTAAKVARCAGPIRRFGFVSLFFSTQAKWVVNGPDSNEELAKAARQGGMTREQFDQCAVDKTAEQAVLSDRLEGINKYNVQATPSFIFGSETWSPQDGTYEEFVAKLKKHCGF